MISIRDAKVRRINRLDAQILRRPGSPIRGALLKVFFNDKRLIFDAKYTDSAGLVRVEIG